MNLNSYTRFQTLTSYIHKNLKIETHAQEPINLTSYKKFIHRNVENHKIQMYCSNLEPPLENQIYTFTRARWLIELGSWIT